MTPAGEGSRVPSEARGSGDRDRDHLRQDLPEDVGCDPALHRGAGYPGEDAAGNPDRHQADQGAHQEEPTPDDGHHGGIDENDQHDPQAVGELAGHRAPTRHGVLFSPERAARRLDRET